MKKVIITAIITLLLAVCAVPVAISFIGLTNVATIKLNTDNVKIIYDLNEEFSAEGLKVETSKKDGVMAEIVDYTVDSSAFKADTVGKYEIKVVVDEKDYATYTVEVKDKGTLSLVSDNLFYVDQDIEESALKIKHTPTNGEAKEITDYKIISCNNNEEGNKTLVVEYQSFRYDIAVNVVSVDTYIDKVMQKVISNANNNNFDVKSLQWKFASTYPFVKMVQTGVNTVYVARVDESLMKEFWVDNQELTLIQKTSYLDDSTLPFFNVADFNSIEELTEYSDSMNSLSSTYQMLVTILAEIYQNLEHGEQNCLYSYKTDNGMFTFAIDIIDLRYNECKVRYSVTIDLASGNLISATNIPVDGVMDFAVNQPVESKEVPAVPSAQDKGVVSVKSGSKLPVKTGSGMEIAPIGGAGSYKDLNLEFTLNGKTYPLYYGDYTVVGYDDSTVGTKTVIVNYNTFTYPVQIEIVSALDYIKYIYEIAKEETYNKTDYIGAVNNFNNYEAEYMIYDKFSDVLYCNNRHNSALPENQRGEIWIESDGTVTKKGVTGNVTKTKFDSQEVALIAAFHLDSEETMKLSEFIGYYTVLKTSAQLNTIITNLTEEQIVGDTNPEAMGTGTYLGSASSRIVIKVGDITYNLNVSSRKITGITVSDNNLQQAERIEAFDKVWQFDRRMPYIPSAN